MSVTLVNNVMMSPMTLQEPKKSDVVKMGGMGRRDGTVEQEKRKQQDGRAECGDDGTWLVVKGFRSQVAGRKVARSAATLSNLAR